MGTKSNENLSAESTFKVDHVEHFSLQSDKNQLSGLLPFGHISTKQTDYSQSPVFSLQILWNKGQ